MARSIDAVRGEEADREQIEHDERRPEDPPERLHHPSGRLHRAWRRAGSRSRRAAGSRRRCRRPRPTSARTRWRRRRLPRSAGRSMISLSSTMSAHHRRDQDARDDEQRDLTRFEDEQASASARGEPLAGKRSRSRSTIGSRTERDGRQRHADGGRLLTEREREPARATSAAAAETKFSRTSTEIWLEVSSQK